MRETRSTAENGYPDDTDIDRPAGTPASEEFSDGVFPAVVQTVTESAVELRLHNDGIEKQMIISRSRLPSTFASLNRTIEVQLRGESIIKVRKSDTDSWSKI